jgi:hypothetical protein
MMTSEKAKLQSREFWLFSVARRLSREMYGRRPGDLSVPEWKTVWRYVYQIDRRERERAQ